MAAKEQGNLAPILMFPGSLRARATVLGSQRALLAPVAPCSPGRELLLSLRHRRLLYGVAGGAEAGRGMGTPAELPPSLRAAPEGLPDRTGQLPSTAPAKRPPGHPLPASQRGQESRGGPPTACHHTGQLSVRRGQSPLLGTQDCPSRHGQLSL